MIISDLNYLEVVAEADNVVGGGLTSTLNKLKSKKLPAFVVLPVDITKQDNVAVVNQVANSESAAVVNGKGDATSVANSTNVSTIEQANVGS